MPSYTATTELIPILNKNLVEKGGLSCIMTVFKKSGKYC